MKQEKRIERLIDKIIQGTASPEEEKHVQDYFDQRSALTKWNAAMMGDKEEVKRRLKGKIGHRIKPPASASRTLQQLFPFMKVAAAFLLVCLGAWYMNRQTTFNKEAGLAMEQVIVPGSEKGSLRLSNGQTINLEELAVGDNVYQDGMSVHKNDAGEITYSFLSTSENAPSVEGRPTENTLMTPLGGRLMIALADGTKVWLNSGSTLTFPNVFSASKREVTVSGEAYFQVAKNVNQPFIVQTDKTQIEVLGTEFNVNAYAGEQDNVTTLVEGSIQMHAAGATHQVIPGQKVVMDYRSDRMSVLKADIESVIAWKSNNFVFKNQNIKTIMKEIARWYDVEVTYKGNMEDKFFDVFVSRRENIEEILSMIEMTESIHFKIEGRRVLVIE